MRFSLASIPLFGVLGFLVLYAVAAFVYPGGTKFDPTTSGFSLLHNYWCDLLDPAAYNGAPNPARPIARAALACLALALGIFWEIVPRLFPTQPSAVAITRTTGFLSTVSILLLLTPLHNSAIRLAGFFGIVALVTVLKAFRREGEWRLLAVALAALGLALVNFFIWETGQGLVALPLIQKLAFLVFFFWVGLVSGRVTRISSGNSR